MTVVPILAYHRVCERPEDPFAVSPGRFGEHVAAISRSGRTPLSMTEVAECLQGGRPWPQRPVAITFDDGFADTPEAVARLRDADLRATVYVTTGAVGRGDALTVAQLQSLAGLGDAVELGAHTVSHPRLDELSRAEARHEIIDSKHTLQDMVGRRVDAFAYPHGAYDARVRRLVIDAGFVGAAAVKNALSHAQDDPWAIARWTVTSATSSEQIARVLAGESAPLAWRRERMRTRAFRAVRRTRRRVVAATGHNAACVDAGLSHAPVVGATETPIAVLSADLAWPLADLPVGSPRAGGSYRRAAVFVRSGRQPLGWVSVDVPVHGTLSADALATAIGPRAAAAAAGGRHEHAPERTRERGAQLSVVITTCAQAQSTVGCVHSLLKQAENPLELIVVENRPIGSPVQAALHAAFGGHPALRYVEEPAQGLSRARNAGLSAARGEYIAFIDDDVTVDEDWLAAIRAGFDDDPHISCVTGPILPSELETPAQVLLEQFAAFSKGLERRTHSLSSGGQETPLFPYAAGHFGSGANMAFRTDALRTLGGFDVALGAGTPARGGEDLDISVRLILGGHSIVYEPRAIVWHRHPDTLTRLNLQAFHYGVGLGAMLGKHLLVGSGRLELLARVPAGLRYLRHQDSRKNAGKPHDFPASLTRRERLGMAVGPFAYLLSRAHARRAARASGGRRDAPRSATSPDRTVAPS